MATDHSVAIGGIGTVEHLHVSGQLVLQTGSDRASDALAAVRNAMATADAVLLGPLASTDAHSLLHTAKDLAADNPAGALALYRQVQDRLSSTGFAGHAAEFDQTVATLCVRVGEDDTAMRLLLDALWAAESAGNSLRVQRVVSTLRSIAGFSDFGPVDASEARTSELGAAYEIAEFVSDHVHSPLPARIELPDRAVEVADPIDRARTLMFAAEQALSYDDLAWIIEHKILIESTAGECIGSNPDVAVRLRLALADAIGEWTDLVQGARTGLRRELKALVLARYARHKLLQAAPAEADNAWSEAISEACLLRRHADAADWLYSQRYVASRYLGVLDDKWHPLAQALTELPSEPRILPYALDARERALAALHRDEQRAAAIDLRRRLLDAIRSASFHDELDARRLLGETYRSTGDLELAAWYSIGAGDYEQARKVAVDLGDAYRDVTESIESPLSWVSASALQFAAEQADLIPDDVVDTIIDLGLAAINDVMSGARMDSAVFSPQMYLSSYRLIAALADRLDETHARVLLDKLADSVTVQEHHYRQTDESHVKIAAGIASSQTGELRAIAVKQLLGLYERASHHFGRSERAALTSNLDQIRDHLQGLADRGHREATALLGLCEPDRVSPETAAAAAKRLCTPTTNGPSRIGTGTGAINDSIVAAVLPAEERITCIEMLLSNAASPWEPSSNRDDYLRAASNLVDGIDEPHRQQFFDRATTFAENPPVSHADALNASMSSPLGSMRIGAGSDWRPAATYLAARLASSVEERRRVRDIALRLIGVGRDDDYGVATTLQLVRSELDASVGLLAQGSWPLRSVAAILWAESPYMPDELGHSLSQDRDPRVRRALASALREADPRIASLHDVLLLDPRWSVRSILLQPDTPVAV